MPAPLSITGDAAFAPRLAQIIDHSPLCDMLGPRERLALAQTCRELNDAMCRRGGLRADAAALARARFAAGQPVVHARRPPVLPPDPMNGVGVSSLRLSPSLRFVAVELYDRVALCDMRHPQAPPDCIPCEGPGVWSPVNDVLLTQWQTSATITAPLPLAGLQDVTHARRIVLDAVWGASLRIQRNRVGWLDSGDAVLGCEHPGVLVSVHPGTLKKRSIWRMAATDGPLKSFFLAPSGARVFVQTSGPAFVVQTRTGVCHRCAAPEAVSRVAWVDNERAIALTTAEGATVFDACDGTVRHRIATGMRWPLSHVAPDGRTLALMPPTFANGSMGVARQAIAGHEVRLVKRINGRTGVNDHYVLWNMAWSNDAHHLAAYSNKRFLHVVDVNRGWESDTVLDMHACFAWSPSGTFLATAPAAGASEPMGLYMRDPQGKLLWSHRTAGAVTAIAWSDDEMTLAALQPDGACDVLHFVHRSRPDGAGAARRF